MKLTLDTEQQMLKDSVERFVADNCGVDERRRLRDSGELMNPAVWQQMVELGWTALGVPEVRVIGPKTLQPSSLEQLGVHPFTDMEEGLRDVDVIIMLRLQSIC